MRRSKLIIKILLVLILFMTVNVKSLFSETEFMWGNLVLDHKMDEMKKAKVNPVVYPHWFHRLMFRCKVCHLTIVIDKKGGNDITMDKINNGKVCGTCHNGKIAFGPKECERCHSLQDDQTLKGPRFTSSNILKPEMEAELKEIAKRVGAEWNLEKMEGKDFPRDRYGFINWVDLMSTGLIKPIHSLNPNEKDERRDNKVLFQVLGDFVDNVIFPHDVHTLWVKCEQCHDKLFKPVAGANRIRMRDMVKAQNFCIHCHGKVSFPAASCTGCHKYPRDTKFDETVIKREELPDSQVIEIK